MKLPDPVDTLTCTAIQAVLDCIFPRHCIHCGGRVGRGPLQFICADCRAALDFIEPPHCLSCGYPFWGQMSVDRICHKCRDLNPSFSGGRSLILHRDVGSLLVHQLKYNMAGFLKPDIQWLMKRNPEMDVWFHNAVLIPVPLHPRKERERGYNQSEHLCRWAVEMFPGCRLMKLLKRVKDTDSQTSLGVADRRRNVKNAFAICGKAVLDPALKYILVDDVFTTGSTLDACATVLSRAGVQSPRIFSLAHG